jgi:hypothetical protein
VQLGQLQRAVGLGVVLTLLYAPATVASSPPSVAVDATPGISHGGLVTLSGNVEGVPADTPLQLVKSAYPYRSRRVVGKTDTAADGSFKFGVHPDRNAWYRVNVVGNRAHASVHVRVAGKLKTDAQAIALGRAQISLLIYHPRDLDWDGAPVHWAFGAGRNGPLQPVSSTKTIRLSRYAIAVRTTVTLPAGRYRWRACLRLRDARALYQPHRPPTCVDRGYSGTVNLPVGYPSPAAVANATRFLATRSGVTAFAVVDSEGRLSGVNLHETFVSASVVKAMLLVAYLRRLDAMGQHFVDANSNSFLYPMINVSDNGAATHTWSIVGNSGLYAMAAAAGMTDYSVYTDWASSQISVADQARFFFEMDSLIPKEFVGYARRLLSTIAGYESWGIPAVARPHGYTVFFKGGWRGTSIGQLVHQIGRLEGHGRTFSIAVMTNGDPSMGYGIDTIQGVTAALL